MRSRMLMWLLTRNHPRKRKDYGATYWRILGLLICSRTRTSKSMCDHKSIWLCILLLPRTSNLWCRSTLILLQMLEIRAILMLQRLLRMCWMTRTMNLEKDHGFQDCMK